MEWLFFQVEGLIPDQRLPGPDSDENEERIFDKRLRRQVVSSK